VRAERDSPWWRHAVAAGTVVCGVALCAALAGCGDAAVARPAWVGSHPDTALLSFETTAPGVCAITVQYPNDAPSAIGYLGSTYVQLSRRAHPASPSGRDLGASGDWHAFVESGGDILLVTRGDAFEYKLEAGC
jgi:hypothetical protein